MDVDGKVTSIHAATGIAAGYISSILTNETIVIIVAIIILYVSGQLSERLFGREEVGGAKGWLWSGIVPFFFVWIMVWLIFSNL